MEDRILTLSGLFLLTNRSEFAERAKQEMIAASAFPDWYPEHFLDTAELTAALGIGYDWLDAELTPEERITIRSAIVNKGIKPWLRRIRSGNAEYTNNWVQVCHGGETLGALAIADEEPALANDVLDYAKPAMEKIMGLFAPDGGFEEGPAYWNYATAYNVLYLAALDSALGGDFGTSNASGFSRTGDYRIQSIGPIYLSANFGDAHPEVSPAPQMFWLARRFDRPAYAEQGRKLTRAVSGRMDSLTLRERSRFQILGVFWSAEAPHPQGADYLSKVESFTRVNQAFLRSSWQNPKA